MNSIDVHNADNISLRATKLGFADTKSYQDSVRMQCVAGNHANCDVLTSGTHQPCANVSHSGINCNGTQHNGADHCFNHNNSVKTEEALPAIIIAVETTEPIIPIMGEIKVETTQVILRQMGITITEGAKVIHF